VFAPLIGVDIKFRIEKGSAMYRIPRKDKAIL
jgi:hypothetical protein